MSNRKLKTAEPASLQSAEGFCTFQLTTTSPFFSSPFCPQPAVWTQVKEREDWGGLSACLSVPASALRPCKLETRSCLFLLSGPFTCVANKSARYWMAFPEPLRIYNTLSLTCILLPPFCREARVLTNVPRLIPRPSLPASVSQFTPHTVGAASISHQL